MTDPDAIPDDVNEHVSVHCSSCGRLGRFHVTPQQHLDGAWMRAVNLSMYHRHVALIRVWNRTEDGWVEVDKTG